MTECDFDPAEAEALAHEDLERDAISDEKPRIELRQVLEELDALAAVVAGPSIILGQSARAQRAATALEYARSNDMASARIEDCALILQTEQRRLELVVVGLEEAIARYDAAKARRQWEPAALTPDELNMLNHFKIFHGNVMRADGWQFLQGDKTAKVEKARLALAAALENYASAKAEWKADPWAK